MRGWIALLLAAALAAAVLMKIPIDTQFFTIINSVLVAYVVQQNSSQHAQTNRLSQRIDAVKEDVADIKTDIKESK